MRHNPIVLPEIRRHLREAKEEGKDVDSITLSDKYFKAYVLATKPSAREQLEDYFRGLASAPDVSHRKIPVLHQVLPTDGDDVVLGEGKLFLFDVDDSGEAPIV